MGVSRTLSGPYFSRRPFDICTNRKVSVTALVNDVEVGNNLNAIITNLIGTLVFSNLRNKSFIRENNGDQN